MTDVPGATPERVLPKTVATPVLLLLQTPPVTASLNVIEASLQTVEELIMVPANGIESTLMTEVAHCCHSRS